MENTKIQLSGGLVSPENAYKLINTTYHEKDARILYHSRELLESIKRVPLRETYIIENHSVPLVHIPGNPSEKEQWTCKVMAHRYKDGHLFGKIVGYQIPLSAPGEDNSGLGDLDLLSVSGDTAYILEVKAKDSREHPLKAFLQAYTYWKQLGGDNAKDFLERSEAKGCSQLDKAVVLYENSPIFNKLINSSELVKKFIRWLNVKCFLVKEGPEPQTFNTIRVFDV